MIICTCLYVDVYDYVYMCVCLLHELRVYWYCQGKRHKSILEHTSVISDMGGSFCIYGFIHMVSHIESHPSQVLYVLWDMFCENATLLCCHLSSLIRSFTNFVGSLCVTLFPNFCHNVSIYYRFCKYPPV